MRPTGCFKRNLVAANVPPKRRAPSAEVRMYAGSIAIPSFNGNNMNPDDNNNKNNDIKVGNQFFKDLLGSFTKDQKK